MSCGADLPPLRLSVIKTLALPSLVEEHGCTDRDCLFPRCKGNHIQVDGMDEVGTGDCMSVTLHIVHHKNDRKGQLGEPVILRIPDGALLDLLRTHIKWGRECFDLGRLDVAPTLFVSNYGNSFNDATFAHYWTWVMGSCTMFGFSRFPPSFARTVFVTEYRSRMTASECEAAAAVMGNSVRTWDRHYNPCRKRKLIEIALASHPMFVQTMDC